VALYQIPILLPCPIVLGYIPYPIIGFVVFMAPTIKLTQISTGVGLLGGIAVIAGRARTKQETVGEELKHCSLGYLTSFISFTDILAYTYKF